MKWFADFANVHTRLCLSALLLGQLMAVSLCRAQTATTPTIMLDLPRQSQHATVSQRIGITDITIDYSRPLANGRQIWSNVAPYGQVWRVGANENTTITFSDPVTIEGQPLDKGAYGLYAIPGENEWTLIFSKASTAWGLVYKQEDDALRVTVKPKPAEFHEALAFDFDEVKPGSAAVTLRWDKIAVPFRVEVKVTDIVEASLQRQMRGIAQFYWEGWNDAAGYLLANRVNLDEALKYEDQSIQLDERFENLIDKSRILDALGRKDAATEFRNRALSKGNAVQLYGYGRKLQGDGKQEEAFALYRSNAKKFPDDWNSHLGLARVYSGQGDFDNAAKEMKLALMGASETSRSTLQIYLKRLQAKDDINR